MNTTALFRLDHVLKLSGSVETGGIAKHLIQSGKVTVNGIVETRRKKKLMLGDKIEIAGEVIIVGTHITYN
ncbi:MAG: RNA-binding protein [Trueperaceae bacterium]|mgnify:CR=1 FL=1|jgi:ribosome-associated protein|nr:RNA-binding protein [Trueperaceae bacterium]|tara:strand:- start:16400 stop:16612 length:213 start_codon:yes stop_codon:yes gene_type:complete